MSIKNHLPTFNRALARGVTEGFRLVLEQGEPVPAEAGPSGPRLHHHSIFTHNYGNAFLNFKGETGSRNILLVVDFSGSMSGMWTHQGGAEFVWGLMMLAREGAINLRVFLTGECMAELPINISFKQFCTLFPSHSVEGYRAALKHRVIAPLLDDADAVICWTDGQLTDGHVNALEWKSRGVKLIGACIGNPKSRAYFDDGAGHASNINLDEAMRRHFHSGVLGSCPVKIATNIATTIAQTQPRALRTGDE
jgi:hypothetical protein